MYPLLVMRITLSLNKSSTFSLWPWKPVMAYDQVETHHVTFSAGNSVHTSHISIHILCIWTHFFVINFDRWSQHVLFYYQQFVHISWYKCDQICSLYNGTYSRFNAWKIKVYTQFGSLSMHSGQWDWWHMYLPDCGVYTAVTKAQRSARTHTHAVHRRNKAKTLHI